MAHQIQMDPTRAPLDAHNNATRYSARILETYIAGNHPNAGTLVDLFLGHMSAATFQIIVQREQQRRAPPVDITADETADDADATHNSNASNASFSSHASHVVENTPAPPAPLRMANNNNNHRGYVQPQDGLNRNTIINPALLNRAYHAPPPAHDDHAQYGARANCYAPHDRRDRTPSRSPVHAPAAVYNNPPAFDFAHAGHHDDRRRLPVYDQRDRYHSPRRAPSRSPHRHAPRVDTSALPRLKQYDGKSDVNQLITSFRAHALAHGWIAETQAAYLPLILTERALDVYHQIAPVDRTDISYVLNALKEQLMPSAVEWLAKFHSHKPAKNEPTRDFALELAK
jgi:hypothetical protein